MYINIMLEVPASQVVFNLRFHHSSSVTVDYHAKLPQAFIKHGLQVRAKKFSLLVSDAEPTGVLHGDVHVHIAPRRIIFFL